MPTVLLSAQPPQPPDDWGDLPGFDAVLLKPASGAEVLECVGTLLKLAWLRAKAASVPPRLDEADLLGPAGNFPPAADCAELAGLARQGAVYEIEEWIAHTRQLRPESEAFFRAVEVCLAGLDFEGIGTIVSLPQE
jgi:hypothetical protein